MTNRSLINFKELFHKSCTQTFELYGDMDRAFDEFLDDVISTLQMLGRVDIRPGRTINEFPILPPYDTKTQKDFTDKKH